LASIGRGAGGDSREERGVKGMLKGRGPFSKKKKNWEEN